eukprot:3484862-Rhodomonas_salina.3
MRKEGQRAGASSRLRERGSVKGVAGKRKARVKSLTSHSSSQSPFSFTRSVSDRTCWNLRGCTRHAKGEKRKRKAEAGPKNKNRSEPQLENKIEAAKQRGERKHKEKERNAIQTGPALQGWAVLTGA